MRHGLDSLPVPEGERFLTGFGLLGHTAEIASASGVCAVISQRDGPEYSGAREALKNGYVTRGDRTNTEYVHSLGPLDGEPESLLFDPQTSGGLLIGVPSERSESLLHTLKAAGFEQTARIGHVEAGTGIRLI